LKASILPAGPAPGAWREPRLIGRIPARVSLADRYRLAVARVNLLGLLEQDNRLPSLFTATSKRLGLRPGGRQLRQQVKRNERALWAAMSEIACSLGLRWPWIAHDLLCLYLARHLKLIIVSNTERPPFEEPAPKRVRFTFTPFPGSTMAEARREAGARIAELLPSLANDARRAPRGGAAYLSDAVYWLYLRRCIAKPFTERGLALYLTKQSRASATELGKPTAKRISRARVRQSVGEVERLFSLIQ